MYKIIRDEPGSYHTDDGRFTIERIDRDRGWRLRTTDGAQKFQVAARDYRGTITRQTLAEAREAIAEVYRREQLAEVDLEERVASARAVAERVALHTANAEQCARKARDVEVSPRERRIAAAAQALNEAMGDAWRGYGVEVFGRDAYRVADEQVMRRRGRQLSDRLAA